MSVPHAPADLPTERLETEITELAGHLNAATCRWLCLIGELDHREAWAEWGCRTCAEWVSWRCGLSPATAREHVRVARALADLPVTRETFGRGELSYSQVRALTRIVTPETERDMVEIALLATAAQLEVIVRAYRGVLERELGGEHRQRWVRCEHDDDGALYLTARLPAEEGELVLKALAAGRAAARAGSVSAETTLKGDNADALLLMADTLLVSGPAERTGGDSHQVVVHVDVGTLAGDDGGMSETESGTALHPETARRLACDASIVRILERDGRPLSVGRKTRSISPAVRRALRSRDCGCRFPGCTQHRFLHAHHIEHWAHGGRTDLSNLIHLCSHHHRLVHEGGYKIERRSGGRLCFRRPDGTVLAPVPRRRRGETPGLVGRNLRRGVAVSSDTAVSGEGVSGERFYLDQVIASMTDRDPRLLE